MIVSKPKFNALFSIGVFLTVCFALGIINLRILFTGSTQWFNYLIVGVTLPLGITLLIRQLLSFKIVTVGNETFKVARPLIFSGYQFKLKDVDGWEETSIETKNGKFRELSIANSNGKTLKLTFQENSNYDKVLKYLNKKLPRKRIRSGAT